MSTWLPYGTIVVPEVDQRSDWRKDWDAYLERQRSEGVMIRTINAAVKAPILAPKPVKVCKPQKHHRVVRTKFCAECGKPLIATNKSGLCNKHLRKKRAIEKRGVPIACSKCGCRINRNNTLGLCQKDAGPLYHNRKRTRMREERKLLTLTQKEIGKEI